MKYIYFLSIIAITLSCSAFNKREVDKPQTISKEFDFKIFTQAKKETENLFISPLSIKTALSMTMEGAAENTKAEMLATLNLNEDEKLRLTKWKSLVKEFNQNIDGLQISLANSLWLQKGFKFNQNFVQKNEKFYNAEIQKLNFAEVDYCVKEINDWISQNTNEKIKKVVSPNNISELTRLILANAIYFKADWANQFKEKSTYKSKFYNFKNIETKIDFMYQKEKFNYVENDEYQFIELPYKNEDYSMFVLLPKKNDNFNNFISNFDFENLTNIEKQMQSKKTKLYLPKFKMKSSLELNEILQKMGIKDAFIPTKANFSKIEPTNSLYISKVLHKTFLEVNEEGSEAAAATVVTMKAFSAKPEPVKIFKANHPFFFYMKNKKTNTILFMGQKVK